MLNSPVKTLGIRRAAPPQMSCMPAEAVADMLAACRCEMIEPVAQQKAAASRISTMPGSIELASAPWEGRTRGEDRHAG